MLVLVFIGVLTWQIFARNTTYSDDPGMQLVMYAVRRRREADELRRETRAAGRRLMRELDDELRKLENP